MKPRPKITARVTSLAHAFVHAIIPRQVDKQKQKSLYEKSGIVEGECAYCGDRASDGDHFRALVKGGRPSGYFHTADNIIPSCGRCNQSKSGAHWRSWISGAALHSPATREIPDLETRIERLSAFEALVEREATPVAYLREKAGVELWDEYWARLDRIKADLVEAENAAAVIRERLDHAFRHDQNSN